MEKELLTTGSEHQIQLNERPVEQVALLVRASTSTALVWMDWRYEIEPLMDVLVLMGQRCKMFLDDTIVNVPVTDVQADELWSFVYCKDKTRKSLSLPVKLYGDKYCFVGMERHHKLVLAWHVGSRDIDNGQEFLLKLSRACWQDKFQLTADGWQPYRRLVPHFLRRADFGVLIKVYGKSPDTVRYSPAPIIEVKYKNAWGEPELERMCTSHIERGNLTIRMA